MKADTQTAETHTKSAKPDTNSQPLTQFSISLNTFCKTQHTVLYVTHTNLTGINIMAKVFAFEMRLWYFWHFARDKWGILCDSWICFEKRRQSFEHVSSWKKTLNTGSKWEVHLSHTLPVKSFWTVRILMFLKKPLLRTKPAFIGSKIQNKNSNIVKYFYYFKLNAFYVNIC